jgi:hypothetical protein
VRNNKKGQMTNAVPVLIMLVIGVAVITVTQIVTGVLGAKTYQATEDSITSIGDNKVVDEAFTPYTYRSLKLSHAFVQEGTLTVENGTTRLSLNNFSTIDYDAGRLYLKVDSQFNATALNANYTWGASDVRNSIQSAVVAGFNTQKDTAELTPIVVLSVIMGVVILSIFSYMNFSGGGKSENAL